MQKTAGNLDEIITKKLLSPQKQQREVQSPFYKFLTFFQKTEEKTSILSYIPAECITFHYIYAIVFKKELKRRPESDFQKEKK